MKVMVKEIQANKVVGKKVFRKAFVVVTMDGTKVSPVEFISKEEAEMFAKSKGELTEVEYKVVKAGRSGKKTHLAHSFIDGNGKKQWSVGCSGATSHSSRKALFSTYQKVTLENITCESCKKKYLEALGE